MSVGQVKTLVYLLTILLLTLLVANFLEQVQVYSAAAIGVCELFFIYAVVKE